MLQFKIVYVANNSSLQLGGRQCDFPNTVYLKMQAARSKFPGGYCPLVDRAAEIKRRVIKHLERAITLNAAKRERARILRDQKYPKIPLEDDFEIFKREGNRQFEELLRKAWVTPMETAAQRGE